MYSYLKCIAYDKLLKSRQSFRITLYFCAGVYSYKYNYSSVIIFYTNTMPLGTVVKVLCYKSEGRRFVPDGVIGIFR